MCIKRYVFWPTLLLSYVKQTEKQMSKINESMPIRGQLNRKGNHFPIGCLGVSAWIFYFKVKNMKAENPFENAVMVERKEQFVLHTKLWRWSKTDDLSGGEPFYDQEDGGVLFESTVNCPVCGFKEVFVMAGMNTDRGVLVDNFMYCQGCNTEFNITGQCGTPELEERYFDDGSVIFEMELPCAIVVECTKGDIS